MTMLARFGAPRAKPDQPASRPSVKFEHAPRRQSAGASAEARSVLGPLAVSDAIVACCTPTVRSGVRDLVFETMCVGAAVSVALYIANPVATAAAAVYVGFRQRGLSNLLHEATHSKLVPGGGRANEVIGTLVASVLAVSFAEYRGEHSRHHGLFGTLDDPKLQSYLARGATSPRRDKFAFIVRVVLGNAIWSLPRATVAAWLRQAGPRYERLVRLVAWSLLIVAASLTSNVGPLVSLWVFPLLFVRPTVNLVTDLANHLGLIQNADIVRRTRGFSLHPVVRHLWAAHHDDAWHPVHHLLPRVQHRRLHDALLIIASERPDVAARIPWCSGLVFRRRRTPNVPSVFDHIVLCLRRTSN